MKHWNGLNINIVNWLSTICLWFVCKFYEYFKFYFDEICDDVHWKHVRTVNIKQTLILLFCVTLFHVFSLAAPKKKKRTEKNTKR